MKKYILPVIFLLILPIQAISQAAPASEELTKLLNDFLAGASRDDGAMHDRFWADDLIYTGSSGRRIGKADIMRDARDPQSRTNSVPSTIYTAADVRIQQYGDTAIVAFRLVATTQADKRSVVSNYYNTGTFLKRNGKWQAVSWQATRIPISKDQAIADATATSSAFFQSLNSSDAKTVEALTDTAFEWVDFRGTRITRQQLSDSLRSGSLKSGRMQIRNTTCSVFGDTAIVHVTSFEEGVPDRAKLEGGKLRPLEAVHTLTLVNSGGLWKAVALHSSR